MATQYPAKIDNNISLPLLVDNVSSINADVINRLRNAIIVIEEELGVSPASVFTTVKERLDSIEDTIGNLEIISLSGDLGGNLASPQVVGIRGKPISTAAPTAGQVLGFNGVNWLPMNVSGGGGGGGGAGFTVQTGYNYGPFLDIVGFPNTPSTNENIFVNGATLEFDPTILTAANGTREIKLRVIAETTDPVMSIQLYNLTTNSVVAGSDLSTSSSVATLLETSDLTANLTSGSAVYQIQIKMAPGTPEDRATLVYAALRVEWS